MMPHHSDHTPTTPPVTPPRPQRRHKWSAPLLAALGVAFPVLVSVGQPHVGPAGGEQAESRSGEQVESRPGQQAESRPSEQESSASGERPPSPDGSPTNAAALDRIDVDVDRPVTVEGGRIGAAAAELERLGLLGADDTLTPVGRERRLGDLAISRASQEHNGIPVFAAQVVIEAEDRRIVRIAGRAAKDIHLDTTTPAHDYLATVALAERLLDQHLTADGEGALVIFPVDGAYRLAWLGVVVIDSGFDEVALDAETGRVLHRAPTSAHTLPGRAPAEGNVR